MTPKEFRQQLRQNSPRPGYLFVGPDAYQRQVCREALLESFLTPEERLEGVTRHDLEEAPLAVVLDDARSLSLFAARRVIFAGSAEAAVPKVLRQEADEAQRLLEAYLADPPDDVVVVLECTRYGFEGDDKAKLDRVLKYFALLGQPVEFKPLSRDQALALAESLARKAGLTIAPAELELLVEVLGAEAARIAVEIEKLRLCAGPDGRVSAELIEGLAPDARAQSIFGLVDALGRNDALAALESLHLLVRQGEYLPLALAFLNTQLRLALVVREEQLRTPSQIRAYFSGMSIPMWPSRIEQVRTTAARFTKPQILGALARIHEADRGLRSARPDDRTVVESMIVEMAAPPETPGARAR